MIFPLNFDSACECWCLIDVWMIFRHRPWWPTGGRGTGILQGEEGATALRGRSHPLAPLEAPSDCISSRGACCPHCLLVCTIDTVLLETRRWLRVRGKGGGKFSGCWGLAPAGTVAHWVLLPGTLELKRGPACFFRDLRSHECPVRQESTCLQPVIDAEGLTI